MSAMMENFEHGLKKAPVIGILRGFEPETTLKIAEASHRGGLRLLEVTMNTDGAAAQIAMLREKIGDKLVIGAGTVCSMEDLETALGAEAQFIVTPITVPEVIKTCRERGVPVVAGALTPTEVWTAWEVGATLVKIFPAGLGGPDYIRDLRGPLNKIRLAPTGGVRLDNIGAYLDAGAEGFGLGSPLFPGECVKTGDWGGIAQHTSSILKAIARHKR